MAESHHELFHDNYERLKLHVKPKVSTRVRPTAEYDAKLPAWQTERHATGHCTKNDWSYERPEVLRDYDMLGEAERCLKCADAPCSKGCPCDVDIHSFIYALSKKGGVYQAARVIYSDNPLGLTCAALCATEKQCQSSCNLRQSLHGSIDIAEMQRYACENFLRMQIPQVKPEAKYSEPIAMVGSGPASLSCATYLARLGYSNVKIFEAGKRAGGVPTWIPDYRIPREFIAAEVAMVEELGVEIKYESPVKSVMDLQAQGYKSVFVGTGLPTPFTLPIFDAVLGKCPNLIMAPDFLKNEIGNKPVLSGNVLVLGGGDVAFNCAAAALRCGASRVTVAFREDMRHRPCGMEELLGGIFRTHVELLPFVTPVKITQADPANPASPIVAVELRVADWAAPVEGEKPTFDAGSTILAKCNHVIVAFGSKPRALEPLGTTSRGLLDVNLESGQSKSHPWVFAGGDIIGSNTVVKAVNDGKTAAWHMHVALSAARGTPIPADAPAILPPFRTVVDDVDISFDCLGIHFLNPFGLSSATPTGSIGMIRRAFEMGWAFAVTKTAMRIPATNVSPRISGSSFVRRGATVENFFNMELLTEKTLEYWVEGTKELKKHYPKNIVIFSIMSPAIKEEWEYVALKANESGADAMELNLSCPHVGKGGFGMLAGQNPESVKQITQWVKAVAKIPVIVKLTPNVTDITAIARAAKEGGADAVTAINTVSILNEIQPDGHCKPNVGTNMKTAFGGMSGNAIRPLALKAVAAITNNVPGLPIFSSGGCDSGDAMLQFIYAGAGLNQITSAIQNQDYAIIDEMTNDLKALLYIKGRPDLSNWRGQMPPQHDLPKIYPRKPVATSRPIPRVADLRGITPPEITVVPNLELEHQVMADVDESLCLRCGKCFASCADTGYHAIELDPNTHKVKITEDCMGCGLCRAVCPANCISYVKKPFPHVPLRGIPDPKLQLPFDK